MADLWKSLLPMLGISRSLDYAAPTPTPSVSEDDFLALYGCEGSDVCEDYGNDCCAPRSEVRRCAQQLDPYCEDGDDSCCYYVCCESEPAGYHPAPVSGWGEPPSALAAGLGVALGIVFLMCLCKMYYRPVPDQVHGINGLKAAVKRSVMRALDATLAIFGMVLPHYILMAIAIDPWQAINIPGGLIVTWMCYASLKGNIQKDELGCAGCLQCFYGACMVVTLCIIFPVSIDISSSTIPALGVMAPFYLMFGALEFVVVKECKHLTANGEGTLFGNEDNQVAHAAALPITIQAPSTVIVPQVAEVVNIGGEITGAKATATGAGSSGSSMSLVEALRQLKESHEAGLLTDEEHQNARKETLAKHLATV